MNKCFVTKYAIKVDNDNLNILGAFYLSKIEAGNTYRSFISNLQATEDGKCVLRATGGTARCTIAGDGNTYDLVNSGYPVKTTAYPSPLDITITADSEPVYLYVTNKDYLTNIYSSFPCCEKTLSLGDGENMKSISLMGQESHFLPFNFKHVTSIRIYNADGKKPLYGTLSGSKSESLTDLNVNDYLYSATNLKINVDTLDLPNLKVFSSINCILSGNIQNFNSINLTSITIVGIGNYNVNNIENFAKAQVAKGRTSGTCKITIESTVKTVTFSNSVEGGYSIS